MANVSRLELNHPALGTTGGAGLHASIEALYTKIGDNMQSRWYSITDFDQTETVDLQHNFEMDISLLRYDLWNYTGGEWVKVTSATTPNLSNFAIIEKVGFEDTVLQITNNTGGNDLTFAVSIVNDPIYLSEGDVEDVDITTVAPADGEALVWNSAGSKFKPGASGDASFKMQSLAANLAAIKAGSIFLDDGKELYLAADLTALNLKTQVNDTGVTAPAASTAYYVYLDLAYLPAQTLVGTSDRKVYAVASGTSGMFKVLATGPEATDLSRYVPLYSVKTDGSSDYASAFQNLAFRRHQVPAVNVSPLVYEDADHSIGTVGALVTTANYGELSTADFPNTTTLHIYKGNEASGTTLNDSGVSAITLPGTGTPLFNNVGFFGRESIPVNLNGTTQYFSSSNAEFTYDTASGATSMGGWFYKDNWVEPTNEQCLLNIGTTFANSIDLQTSPTSAGVLRVTGFNSSVDPRIPITTMTPGWHHVVVTMSTTTCKLYVDGQLAATGTLAGGTTTAGFFVGAANNGASQFFTGKFQDVFIHKGTVLSDSQVNSIYSKRFKGAGQLAGGHVLEAASFPLASLTNKVSAWNLQALTDLSGNGKSLLASAGQGVGGGGTPNFTGLNIFGVGNIAKFDGTYNLSHVDSGGTYFPAGSAKRMVAYGAWVAAEDWALPSGTKYLFAISDAAGNGVFNTRLDTGVIRFEVGGAAVNPYDFTPGWVDGSWHHIAATWDGTTVVFYFDGIAVGSTPLTTPTITTPSTLIIGNRLTSQGSSAPFLGRMQDFFYIKDYAVTAQDIQKLVASKITPSISMPRKLDQQWAAKFISEDGFIGAELADSWLVDVDDTNLFANFGGGSAARVNLRCFDEGLGASTVPVRKYDKAFTAVPATTLAHGLPSMPTDIRILHNKLADGKYIDIANDAGVKADGTNIYVDLSSYTIDVTHDIRIVASVGVPAIGQPKVDKTITANYNAAVGEKLMTDSSGGAFTITLPPSPGFGDEIEFFDATDSWVPNNVTVARNGSNIEGVAADFTLNVDGGYARFKYFNSAQGWRVY